MKKTGYFIMGVLILGMAVAQGEVKVIAQNTDRGNKVEAKHYYAKNNIRLKDIGGGYSIVNMKEYVPEYKIIKGKYRIIKKEIKGKDGKDKLIIENSKGNAVFCTKTVGRLKEVLVGKKSVYYFWAYKDGVIVYEIEFPGGKVKEIGRFHESFTSISEGYKDWIYLKDSNDEHYQYFAFNLKTGKSFSLGTDYFRKGNNLYYEMEDESDGYGYKRKLYRCNLDSGNNEYLGVFESLNSSHGYYHHISDYDGEYVYYEMFWFNELVFETDKRRVKK